jgi:hypothetical protein
LTARARTKLKLELRDSYAVDAALLAAWRRGDHAAVAERMTPFLERLTAQVAAGVALRRIKVVSEPLSEYMRYAVDVSGAAVTAGEDIRWLPRRLTSILLLPGNDFFVLDDEIALFNVLDGDDGRAEQQLWAEPEVVAQSRGAFEAAWAVAIPHRDYQPAGRPA